MTLRKCASDGLQVFELSSKVFKVLAFSFQAHHGPQPDMWPIHFYVFSIMDKIMQLARHSYRLKHFSEVTVKTQD